MREVVKLSYPEPSIAVIALEDRESCNAFSSALMEGLQSAFNTIQRNEDLKVVIVHGYDTYFCCGGTKEQLFEIHAGDLKFTDLKIFHLLLDLDIPTIAAMQGHALGGGFVFGCYADLMILSEESIYSTNFMKYGFTPGVGATYIVPKKLGEGLGHEMLYGAKNYQGAALKSRGILTNVVKRANVIATAMDLARELADKPRHSLKLLKQHLTQQIKAELPQIIKQESEMHAITFAQPEVKERIERLFGN